MIHTKHLDSLAGCPLFAGLDRDELAAAVSDANVVEVDEGETVFCEGDESRCAYVVLDGEVSIRTHILDQEQDSLPFRPILLKLPTGAVFGEFALLDAEPRSAEACAVVPSTLCVLDSGWLAALNDRDTESGYRVLQNLTHELVDRLRETTDKLRGALEYGWKARGLDQL